MVQQWNDARNEPLCNSGMPNSNPWSHRQLCCSILPTSRLHLRTLPSSPDYSRAFVTSIAKCTLAANSRIAIPLANSPNTSYDPGTKLLPNSRIAIRTVLLIEVDLHTNKGTSRGIVLTKTLGSGYTLLPANYKIATIKNTSGPALYPSSRMSPRQTWMSNLRMAPR